MIPKSTTKLKAGDFCFVQRTDGFFVPFVFLFPHLGRTSFFGGIVNARVDTPDLSKLPMCLRVTEYAVVHVQCFAKNNTPILGNILERIPKEDMRKIEKDVSEVKVGTIRNVWGYKTIFKYANEL